jgi:hypothetical protein
MSQVTKSQKQVDLAVEGANGACEGLKGKHSIHEHARGQKEVDLSLNIASCNRKCVFVEIEPGTQKANVRACGVREPRIEHYHSIIFIVYDKHELWDAHLGASLVR